MKYLKTFESLLYSDYKAGDYVLLDLIKIKSNNKDNDYEMDEVDEYGNSIPIDEFALIKDKTVELNNGLYLYNVTFYNYNNDEDNSYGVESDEIIRKLNKNEIEEFNRKKDALKYNI